MTGSNVFELFAGCGGLGYGFHKEGFNIVSCNELEEPMAKTYKENYPETNVIVGDITNNKIEVVKKLNPKVFVMENVKGILTILHDKENLTDKEKEVADKYYQLESQKLELQAKKKSINHKDKNIDELEKVEKELKEVNKNLKKMKKDLLTFRRNVTDIIKDTFSSLGYKVEMKLLNSANYGVPQKRERVIFIGLRKDINKDISYPEATHNKDGSDGKKKWISVREAIDDLKDLEEDKEWSHIYSKHSETFLEKIKKTPIGKSVGEKYTEAFYRCPPDAPSNTVKENHGGVFIHYEKHRVMTPRELARLQSFPDSFTFKGSKSKILVQLGNAVPCLLSHAIAKEVKKMLE